MLNPVEGVKALHWFEVKMEKCCETYTTPDNEIVVRFDRTTNQARSEIPNDLYKYRNELCQTLKPRPDGKAYHTEGKNFTIQNGKFRLYHDKKIYDAKYLSERYYGAPSVSREETDKCIKEDSIACVYRQTPVDDYTMPLRIIL